MSARRFKTKEDLATAWEEFKSYCDNHTAVKTEFSQKLSDFVTREIHSPISYTIEGFCVWAEIARKNFYEDYAENDGYHDIVTRMKEECEANVREKFELGEIPTQLSGLWMSKFGYTTKTDANVTGAVPIVIAGGDDLED